MNYLFLTTKTRERGYAKTLKGITFYLIDRVHIVLTGDIKK